ncbi:MAG: hypothetical protein ABIG61_03180 [Planctomycetota bacterium]
MNPPENSWSKIYKLAELYGVRKFAMKKERRMGISRKDGFVWTEKVESGIVINVFGGVK